MKPIGRIFRKAVKPTLTQITDPKKLKSVLIGAALIHTMGDIILKDKKGSGLKLAGGALFPETVNLFKKNVAMLSKKMTGSGMDQTNVKKEVPISAQDLLGANWRSTGQEINAKINELYGEQQGQGILKKLQLDHFGTRWKNSMTKAKAKLGQFWAGKTTLKPSQVVGLTAIAIGVAGAVATRNPQVLGMSARAASALGVTSKIAGFASTGLALFGKGLNIPPPLIKFMKKNPRLTNRIIRIINEKKHALLGEGLSSRAKKILRLAGAAGIIGATGFITWYLDASNNGENPISLHELEQSINADIPNVLEHSYEPVPEYISLEDTGDAGGGLKPTGGALKLAGSGKQCGGECDCEKCRLDKIKMHNPAKIGSGIGSDVLNFIKKHKKTALAIVLGTAAVGTALYLGEQAFRDKFNGTATTSSDGLALLKHIITGSDKKFETDRIIMHGQNIVQRIPLGRGMNPKIARLLALAGVTAVPAAIAIAGYALGVGGISGSNNDDDFGDISREEHFEMFGDYAGDGKGGMLPRRIKRLIQANKYIAKKIFAALKKMPGKKIKGLAAKPQPPPEDMQEPAPSSGAGIKRIGTKREVWNGSASRTSGGLTKADLMKNKRGKVVSIKQHKKGLSVAHNLKPIQKKA